MNQPWSKIRLRLEEECLCDSLKGRVRYFATRYRHAHDGVGRVCILVDGKEVLDMPYFNENELYGEMSRRENPGPRASGDLATRMREVKADFAKEGIFDPYDFGNALQEYFNSSIAECLDSDNLLVRMLGIVDRRVGKRTLARLKVKEEVKDMPDWLRFFCDLRLTSEGMANMFGK